jgi:hypothetical protein
MRALAPSEPDTYRRSHHETHQTHEIRGKAPDVEFPGQDSQSRETRRLSPAESK